MFRASRWFLSAVVPVTRKQGSSTGDLPMCRLIQTVFSWRLLAVAFPSTATRALTGLSPRSQRNMSADSVHDRSKCLFCKIADDKSDEGQRKLVYNDDTFVGFRDIRPAAEHHYLIITRSHIETAKSLTKEQKPLLEKMIAVAKETLEKQGADLTDTRLGFHWPPLHTISHIHLHAISPTREMSWIDRMKFKENSYWFVSTDYVLDQLDSKK